MPSGGAPAATPGAPPAPGAAAPSGKKESIFEQLQRAQQQRQGEPAAAPPATLDAAPAVEEPAKPLEWKAPESPEEGADKAPATEQK
ncbi:hypothetical protein [Methylosinus sp. 3S-1]|uniref:hypothetical protein n=1 Tax=Methylosinus sp. 3S-1 TaxID=1849840 RepID=UPI003F67E1EF